MMVIMQIDSSTPDCLETKLWCKHSFYGNRQLVLIYDLYTAYSAMYIYAGNSNSQP